MRQIDLSTIPKYNWRGRECFDWNQSIGMPINFVYDDIEDIVVIIKYDKTISSLTIQYNREEFSIRTEDFKKVKLGSIVHNILFLAPEIIPYFKGVRTTAKKYTPQSNQDVSMICPKCKTEKIMRISNLYNKGFNCICNDGLSRPNKFMYYLLKYLNIDFEREKLFKWCKYKLGDKIRQGLYDFVFIQKDKKYIVEMDGGFHKKPYKGSKYTIADIEFIDSEKNRLAEENGYKIIRIDCITGSFRDMKNNIMASELNGILDLVSVDWDYCINQAEKNLVLEVSQYYMEYKPIKIKEIANAFNLSCPTICDYLKRGAVNNWCDYNVKAEKELLYQNNARRNVERCSKKIAVFKNEQCLEIYDSGKEAYRKSIDDFDVQFNYKKISAVATGREKHHKGFVFKYV